MAPLGAPPFGSRRRRSGGRRRSPRESAPSPRPAARVRVQSWAFRGPRSRRRDARPPRCAPGLWAEWIDATHAASSSDRPLAAVAVTPLARWLHVERGRAGEPRGELEPDSRSSARDHTVSQENLVAVEDRRCPVTKREIRLPTKLRSCTGDESVAERRARVENAAPAAGPHDQAGAP